MNFVTEDSLIKVWDVLREQEVFLKPYIWIKNPNNMPGVYKKSGVDFRTGQEDGRNFWCIGNPKNGRFEWRVQVTGNTATFEILPNYKVSVRVWSEGIDGKSDPQYLYQGYIFFSEFALLLYIYLHNEHDYSDKDMVYFVGKRQYLDRLELLPNNG